MFANDERLRASGERLSAKGERLSAKGERPRANDEQLRVAVLDSIPSWGGGQKWDLQSAWALTQRGHFVAIGCVRGSALERRARELGLPVWSVPLGRFGWRLGSAWSFARFLRQERIGLVVANVGRDLRLGALACRLAGASLLQRRGLLRPVRRDPWNRWLLGRVVRRVIVNSEALRRLVLESAPRLAGRVVLLPNALDPGPCDPAAGRRLREELGVPTDAPLVGAAARLTPMKGFDRLLEAWPLLLEKHPQARLVIFGEGEQGGPLRAQAARLGLGDAVFLAGFREDVDALHAACDVFVLPSVRDESMSHAVLEAMAHGCAVAVSEVASSGLEAARTGGACRVVPTGDPRALARALDELLSDADLRARMGRAARDWALAEHPLEVATDRLEALLCEVREERRGRATRAG